MDNERQRCINCEYAKPQEQSFSILCEYNKDDPVVHSVDHLCMQFQLKEHEETEEQLRPYSEEMVSAWMNAYKDKDETSINDEIEEVKGAISNESLWLNGSDTEEQIRNHAQNIANLTEYLNRLKDLLKED